MRSSNTLRVARRLLVGAVVVGAILLGAVPGHSAWDRWRRCRGHTRFDAAAWRDEGLARGGRAVRGCMVDDLLATRRLPGRPRAAVAALLGEPRPTSYFREYDLVYWLGPERGPFSIDSEWLVLTLDAAGRVADARLVTD